MNKRSKLVFVCGLSLAMLAISTQQTVKADTTTDAQATAVAETPAQTQATQQVTADTENVQSQTTQETQEAPVAESQTDQAVTSSDDQVVTSATQQTTTQANTTSSNITHIKGEVDTKNEMTSLYRNDGTLVGNRALAPNTAWVTDQRLVYNGQTYYRVATNEFANAENVVYTYGGQNETGIVRVKQWGAASYSRNDQGFYRNGQANLGSNTTWKYNHTESSNGLTYYQIASNVWINSNDSAVGPAYQNPNGWLQIQTSQIKPSGGNVGYDLYNGVEGVKVWLVRRYFGYSNAHTIYDGAVANSVRNFQARKGLATTGIVNLNTWKAMGYSESDWYGIDSYVAPLKTNLTSTRSDHVEAMISEAYKYLGQPWISGAASMPQYGVDCSGLVTQALYASGIDSAPISNIQHAQPGHEWNSRDYWADNRLAHVNFNNRQRGDLIFFADPSTGVVWHVGILLNRDTMIESWPFAVQVHSIYSSRGNIVGVKRVFA